MIIQPGALYITLITLLSYLHTLLCHTAKIHHGKGWRTEQPKKLIIITLCQTESYIPNRQTDSKQHVGKMTNSRE